MRCTLTCLLLVLACGSAALAGDFQPDPRTVQRWGKGYRYPQDGWIVLHIEGEPYERGCQHGRLMAPEIAAHVRCFATVLSPKGPQDAWKHARTLVNALFVRRYEREYLEEMKGIADGASAAGARFDGRPIDLVDIVALNSWPEVETLPSALEALPTGLESARLVAEAPAPQPAPKPMHCSAFAATGPATADGKVVFGHITMFSLYPSGFYNVWLDVKPTRGHRVLMQTYPGGMQSGMDYYQNDAGLLVCETTIAQTRFDATGMTVASRIRQAIQYADSIDKAVAILEKANNGLYTNEWLLADTKTNEIAMFELGTHKSKLYRSAKKEWFGGTEGFYWGCNNTKDLDVRVETVASMDGRPKNVVFHPSDRDRKWLQLYDKYKGKMDADFGKLAFTTPPLAAYHSLDAKFTTTDMASDLRCWALFGPPLGRTWQPTPEERKKYPEVRPLVSNPWTVLHAGPPADELATGPAPIDLHDPKTGKVPCAEVSAVSAPPTKPAWHGTLLPRADEDIWLATALAAYEPIVATELALKEQTKGPLSRSARDWLAVDLFAYRSAYELGRSVRPEKPLGQTEARLRDDAWYRVASGKGVLLLHELRRRLGDERFLALMDAFGREHAGKPTSSAEFRATVEKVPGVNLDGFFEAWLGERGLPSAIPEGRCDALRCGPFSILTFYAELAQTLIIYGTRSERATNREAAFALQQAIRAKGPNVTVPVKADDQATEEDLKSHHLLLIGGPSTNAIVARFPTAWPVRFGPQSIEVRGDVCAHPDSAVIAAAESPYAKRYGAVVIAGLSAASTLTAAPHLAQEKCRPAEVLLLPHGGPAQSFVVPAPAAGAGGPKRSSEKPASGGR